MAGSCYAFRTLDHAYSEKSLGSSATRAVEPGSLPQLMSYYDRINAVAPPPCDLVAVSMKRPMVTPAQRHGEFIANPASEGARLCEPQVMCIRRAPPADETRLRRNKPEMRAVAVAAWFAQRECGFVDMPRHRIVDRRQLVF
jgi:hypothetical protein